MNRHEMFVLGVQVYTSTFRSDSSLVLLSPSERLRVLVDAGNVSPFAIPEDVSQAVIDFVRYRLDESHNRPPEWLAV